MITFIVKINMYKLYFDANTEEEMSQLNEH